MEIQRPPEVASKTLSPVRKEARWAISPEHTIFRKMTTDVSRELIPKQYHFPEDGMDYQ